jgi:chromosome segregation ATPase
MKKSYLLALLLTMWFVVPARAVENGATTREQIKTQRAENKATQQEIRDDKCQLTESKINFRLNQMTQARDRHYETYQNISKRISDMISRWEAKGCDVTKLKTQQAEVEKMLADFSAAFRDLESSMQDTKQYQCGDSQGKFVSAAQQARTKNQTLRQKALAIRTYITNTVRPTMQTTMQACMPSPKPSVSPTTGGN